MIKYVSIFIILCLIGGVARAFINQKYNGLKRVISIVMISGMFWCPLTLVYVVKHPVSSISYGIKIGKGLQNAKRDIIKRLPKDKYGITALRTLPRVIANLF